MLKIIISYMPGLFTMPNTMLYVLPFIFGAHNAFYIVVIQYMFKKLNRINFGKLYRFTSFI